MFREVMNVTKSEHGWATRFIKRKKIWFDNPYGIKGKNLWLNRTIYEDNQDKK